MVGHNLCSYILQRFPILCLGDNRNSKFDGYKVEEEEEKTFCSFFTSRSPTFGNVAINIQNSHFVVMEIFPQTTVGEHNLEDGYTLSQCGGVPTIESC